MSLRRMLEELLDQFTCTRCHQSLPTDLRCRERSTPGELVCMRCCACDGHRVEDPGGTVIWKPPKRP